MSKTKTSTLTLTDIEAEITHHVAQATKTNPVEVMVAQLTKPPIQFDAIQNFSKWNMESMIAMEVKRNLWLAAEETAVNMECGPAEAFVQFFKETLERVAFGFADDTSSGRSNDANRTAADATKAWVRDNRFMFDAAVRLQAAEMDR